MVKLWFTTKNMVLILEDGGGTGGIKVLSHQLSYRVITKLSTIDIFRQSTYIGRHVLNRAKKLEVTAVTRGMGWW